MIPAGVRIACYFYESEFRHKWEYYLNCSDCGSKFTHFSYYVILVRIFMELVVGITSFTWILGSKTLKSWRKTGICWTSLKGTFFVTFMISNVLRSSPLRNRIIDVWSVRVKFILRWRKYNNFNNEHNDDARQLGSPAHAKRRWVWPWSACWISLSVLQQCTVKTSSMTITNSYVILTEIIMS